MRYNYSDATITAWDNKTGKQVNLPAIWQVWFTCPLGTFETYGEAETACARNDMLPELCIRPVPVLVAGNGAYEIVL